MPFAEQDLTRDGFLGGRITLLQPRRGYRAATDPVFLAASIPAAPGEHILDLGCGAGAAMFCLAARVGDLSLTGLDLQADYLDLARRNAAANGIACALIEGDVASPPPELRSQSFDRVLINPPYFAAGAATGGGDSGRDTAHRADPAIISAFLEQGLRRLSPGGTLHVIHKADALVALLSYLQDRAGDIRILPIAPRSGKDAGRVIIQAKKGSRSPLRLLPPFIVHRGTAHSSDRADYTDQAASVLRDAGFLPL